MPLPSVRRIDRSSLKEAPSWIEALLTPLNSFMQSVYALLDGGLTIGANVQGQFRSIGFTTPADYASGGFERLVISNPLRNPATCVIIAKISEATSADPLLTSATSVQWSPDPDGVKIRYVAGLQADTRYSATFLIL